nr:DJ-1/PfpI family protein [Sulfobacillus thermosulfidooxidans]
MRPEEYVAVVIPGGRAPEYIRNDPDFVRIVKYFFRPTNPALKFVMHRSL